MTKWTEEQKQKALAIAEATTVREASEQTGIPAGTIKRWRKEERANRTTEPNHANRTKEEREEAVSKALTEAREYIVDRQKKIADELLGVAEDAVREVKIAVNGGYGRDKDASFWLRSLVGAMSQSIEKAQLLTGKPTSRQEQTGQVTKREEYYIEQRLQSDPEARELLKQLYRRSRAMENISEN